MTNAHHYEDIKPLSSTTADDTPESYTPAYDGTITKSFEEDGFLSQQRSHHPFDANISYPGNPDGTGPPSRNDPFPAMTPQPVKPGLRVQGQGI